jgi:hypothetical protein
VHGHSSERQVANNACGACIRDSRGIPKRPPYHVPILSTWCKPGSRRDVFAQLRRASVEVERRALKWRVFVAYAQSLAVKGRGVDIPAEFLTAGGLMERLDYLRGPYPVRELALV